MKEFTVTVRGVDATRHSSYNLQATLQAADPLAALHEALTVWELPSSALTRIHVQASD